MRSIWNIINTADDIEGVTDHAKDHSDPTVEQVRVEFEDGTIIIAANESDEDTGEIDGWTASSYADAGELAEKSPSFQDGSDDTEDFLRLVQAMADWAITAR